MLYKLNKTQLKLNYFLAYLLIAFSGGNNVLLGDALMLLGFLFIAVIFIIKKIKIDDFILVLIGLILVLFVLQSIYTQQIPYVTQVGLLIRILIGYFAIKIIGKEFPKIYINLIVIFSLISFVFYIPILFSPGFEQFLINKIAPTFAHYLYATTKADHPFPQVIIYTINTQRDLSIIPRNCGPFWEPGAFAGYLIIAILFNIIISHKMMERKRGIILAIALLSTLSTSGYLAFGIILVSYFLLSKKLSTNLLLLPFVILAMYFSYSQLDFLGKKIDLNLKYSFSAPPEDLERTRFVGAMLDIKQILENPIIGNGLVPRDYSLAIMQNINHRTNGITDFANKFGVIIFLIYFYSMYKSFAALCFIYNHQISFALIGIVAIFIIGFSELYFTQIIFFSFVFINFLYFPFFPTRKFLNQCTKYEFTSSDEILDITTNNQKQNLN